MEITATRNHSLPRRAWRAVVSVCAILGLLMLVITFTPLVSWWSDKMAGPWTDPKGDTLIVLAGSAGADNVIGYGTYLRCQYAVMAWREGSFRSILVSGGGEGRPQALEMKDFLVASGVPANAIQVETQAHSTRENALNCRRLLANDFGKKVLLTSDYHMFRAWRAFRKVGLDAIPRPFPDAGKRSSTWQGRWPAFLELVEESGKIAYYWARRWI